MTLDEAINRMFHCATAERCAREEACFVVVNEMKLHREKERLQEELQRASTLESDEEEELLIGYRLSPAIPHWENTRLLDWSAA